MIRKKAKTHPAPGNHEYQSTVAPNGEGYYGYFGAAAHGPYGFYSYDVGSWHVVVLNSECTKVSCLAGDGQEVWSHQVEGQVFNVRRR